MPKSRPLGGPRAAVDDGAGAADAEARDDEAVVPSVATLSRDMATSTHVGEVRRVARRRSAHACRECWPERLLRRAGEVGVSGLRLGERSSMRSSLPVALNSRLPNQITFPAGSGSETLMGNGLNLLAIPGDQMGTKEKMSRSGPYLARQLSVS